MHGQGRLHGRLRRETRLEYLERIGDAYGLVLVLILTTFVVTMTLPPEGWGGRVAAIVAGGLTAGVAFTSASVAPGRVRLALLVAVGATVAAVAGKAVSSDALLGIAFTGIASL